MARYRSEDGVEVEAIQLTPDTASYLEGWCGGVLTHSTDALDDTKKFVELNVPTRHGNRRASEGDYVLRYDSGFFNVLAKLVFDGVYKEV